MVLHKILQTAFYILKSIYKQYSKETVPETIRTDQLRLKFLAFSCCENNN